MQEGATRSLVFLKEISASRDAGSTGYEISDVRRGVHTHTRLIRTSRNGRKEARRRRFVVDKHGAICGGPAVPPASAPRIV